jgi:pilus assembly protein Flp/PilA
MKKFMNWLKNEESGQGMVEYGLILALIAVVVIGALTLLGGNVKSIFNDTAGKLTTTP